LPFDVEVTHGSTSDELEELAATFALEALTSKERAGYAEHLRRCGVCQVLAGGFQAVTELLPATLDEQPESAGLKERILNEARRDLTGVRDLGLGARDYSPVPSPHKAMDFMVITLPSPGYRYSRAGTHRACSLEHKPATRAQPAA
jgi:hypothetical protein